MALGRIRLDPEGFVANVEEGLSDIYAARRLYELFIRDPKNPTAGMNNGVGFWNPGPIGQRDWLLPIPRQFNPRWFSDSRAQYHVLKKAQWTFAAGTRVLTFVPPDKLFSGSYPHNEWLSIYAPSSVVSLDSTDYTALFAAAGVTAPAGMKTLAKCGVTPPGVGTPLGSAGYENYTPFVQALAYPPPENAFVFGWSNFAVLMFGSGFYFLQTTGDKKHWKCLYRSVYINEKDYTFQTVQSSNSAEAGTLTKAEVHSVLVAQLGMDSLWLDFLHGGGAMVKWRELGFPPVPLPFPTGPWWVAGAENQKIAFHAEIVGYEDVNTTGNRPILFDFGGPDVWPSQPPTFLPVFTMHREPGEHFTTVYDSPGWSISSPSGERITYELIDKTHNTEWTSGAGNYQGTLFLNLHPGNRGAVNAGFLAPQVSLFLLDFPPVREARANSELILYDNLHYDGWTIESGMYDAPHGGFRISIFESFSEDIENNGFHERSDYPIVYEESDGVLYDGFLVWVPRWKAWADEPELHEETVEGTSGVPGFRRYVIKAKPIIIRMDRKWSALPRISDPDGSGFIEQTFAVTRVVDTCGINIEDPNEWFLYPDPDAGTPRSQLPGTWGFHTGGGQEGDQDVWGPTWNETKLKYCERIAKRWANWAFYCQLNGRILYHPDLLKNPDEYTFFDAFPLFQTSQEAVAEGFRPDQIWTEVVDQEVISPRWNILSIYGCDDHENTVKAVIRDLPSIAGPTTVDNFVGEKKPESFVTRLAVGKAALINLAMAGFRHGTRKRAIRRFGVDLAPWQIEGASDEAFDVGAGFFAAGRGRFVCIHLSCQLKHRDIYRTIITGERIPNNMLLGSFPGFFPGQGLL